MQNTQILNRPRNSRSNKKFIKKLIGKNTKLPCPYCNCVMRMHGGAHPALATVDHIQPKSRGGSNELENLILVCQNCNTRKGSLDQVVMFFLTKPMSLDQNAFDNLNSYKTRYVRVGVIEKFIQKVKEGNLHELVDLIEEFKLRNYGKGYFFGILKFIRDTFNKSVNFALSQSVVIKRLNHILKTERDILASNARKLKHIPFAIYSLTTHYMNNDQILEAMTKKQVA